MKTKRDLVHVCRLMPAVWLALGLGLFAFPAGKAQAQVVVDSADGNLNNSSQASGVFNQENFQILQNVSSNSTIYATGNGGSASANSSVTSQILPLQYSVTNSAGASSDLTSINGYNVKGVGGSGFVVRVHVTMPVRFRLATSLVASVNSPIVDGSSLWASCDVWLSTTAAGGGNVFDVHPVVNPPVTDPITTITTNLSGLLLPGPSYSFHFSAGAQIQAGTGIVFQTGNAQCASQITFDPLPEGANQILGGLLSGGDMRFAYVGIAGTNYALDRTFNLSPPNWVPQMTNPADPSGVLIVTNTPNKATNNFWRVRSVP
jgi:hypothetical protein